MPENENPFVCYRKGRWGLHITPRNRQGWTALTVWVVALLAVIHVLIWFLVSQLGEEWPAGLLIAGSVIGLASLWSIALLRWTLKRSEIIDVDALEKLKQDHERSRRRGS